MAGFWSIVVILSCFKLLLLPSYKSTDFEVHRNWLAITHSLPVKDWYYETRSQWTLDYPPFFAWFEFGLSQVATLFDSAMLQVRSEPYTSNATRLFQQLSVILTDLVLAFAVHQFCTKCVSMRRKDENVDPMNNKQLMLFVLMFGNIGLLIVDHIHFQYNGFLLGVLLLSITRIYEGKHLQGAFWFAVLLNLKQIYLYVAPAYFVYLLRGYCFMSDGPKSRFSFRRFISLGLLVISVFAVSLGPFIYMKQIPQLVSRLFPFKRGLCHAYWAPNFWALYNLADKAALLAAKQLRLDLGNATTASMTGGLVQEFSHSVLPSISPFTSMACTLLSILPALVHQWFYSRRGAPGFVQCLVLCAFGSFMFSWHVHEKAILIVLLPLTLLVTEKKVFARIFLVLSACGHVSLFPLLFTQFETPIKILLFIIYTMLSFFSLGNIHSGRRAWCLPVLNLPETVYVAGLAPLVLYTELVHPVSGLGRSLPFLPLLATSCYCALGVAYCWLRFYVAVLSQRSKVKQG